MKLFTDDFSKEETMRRLKSIANVACIAPHAAWAVGWIYIAVQALYGLSSSSLFIRWCVVVACLSHSLQCLVEFLTSIQKLRIDWKSVARFLKASLAVFAATGWIVIAFDAWDALEEAGIALRGCVVLACVAVAGVCVLPAEQRRGEGAQP